MGFANRDSVGWDSREGYRNQKWDVFGWVPDDWSGNKNDKVTKEEPKENKVTGTTEPNKPKPDLRRNKGTINYPANAPQNRDYLCIKCIKLIKPPRGVGKKGEDKLNSLMGGSGIQYGGVKTAFNDKGEKVAIEGSGGLKWKFGKGASQRSKKAKKTLYTVNLPIPQQVSDNIGVTWGESTMNMFELAGLQIAQDFMEKPAEAASAYADAIKNTNFSDLGVNPEVEKGMRAALSGTALNALSANVTPNQVIGRSTGQILNSNRELVFEGVQLRTFPFNIQFSPRDSEEAKIVLQIIRNFKQSMSPKKGEGGGTVGGMGTKSSGGLFIKSPDVFLLEYKTGGQKHQFLNSFKVCALTSMAVNYTGAGTYATYSDSTPIKITVDLSFKELEPIYYEDYTEEKTGVGY